MDDLRLRFASLESVPMPDLRAEIERRAAQQVEIRVRSIFMPDQDAGRRTLLKLAVLAAMIALIGAVLVAAGVLRLKEDPQLGCLPAVHETSAIDTFNGDVLASVRAWRPEGVAPAPRGLRSGRIAYIAYELPDAPYAVMTLDPETGEHCRLVNFTRNYQTTQYTMLSWSPNGDALAIGLPGRMFVWSAGRLVRVWIGSEFPGAAWSPDGSTLAIWGIVGVGVTEEALPDLPQGVLLVYADGSPDTRLDVVPPEHLAWSPDGTTLAAEHAPGGGPTFPDTEFTVTLIDVETGTETPIGLTGRYSVVRWFDPGSLLVFEWAAFGQGETRLLRVPIAAPDAAVEVARPAAGADPAATMKVAPDLQHVAWSTDDGALEIASLAGGDTIRVGGGLGSGGSIVWAPDSSRLATWSESGIWTLDANGAGARQLANGNVVLLPSDAWQPRPERSE
jgi:hypothetical protein